MAGRDRYILMADIVGSRIQDQKRLMADFKNVTRRVTDEYRGLFSSPIAITLGDEFQCVAKDLSGSVRILFALEEAIIKGGKGFKLKYVLVQGRIDTPLNRDIAYGMLGPGLTAARELLDKTKKSGDRFHFDLKNAKLAGELNLGFLIYRAFVDHWNPKKDYYVVSEFLETDNYKVVAERLGKNRSLMWKRESSLRVREYKAIKKLITGMVEGRR